MKLVAGDTVGPYTIEEMLADGDIVRVYRAVTDTGGERVALKILDADIDHDEVIRRFAREAKVARSVEHPNLARVVDAGRVDGVSYMATAYVEGFSLSSLIEREGPLAPDRLVRVIDGVGSALDALHRKGIVHRDVRSSNVLVREDDVAVLSDFGFARGNTDTRITALNTQVGTLDYRAPEIFVGRRADRASDIYSLGCVAYECLAGAPPFADRRDPSAVGLAHHAAPPPDLTALRPDVPAPFASAVVSALEKDPSRRPPSGATYTKSLRMALRSSDASR